MSVLQEFIQVTAPATSQNINVIFLDEGSGLKSTDKVLVHALKSSLYI